MKAIFGDTIDKIFFWESLKILFFVCFLVLSLDLLLNLVKELEDLNNDYSFGKMFKYLFLISLGRLCEILPLCAVISAILTFGFLSDSGELIAAQILGKSLSSSVLNILKPIIIVLFSVLGLPLGLRTGPLLGQALQILGTCLLYTSDAADE